MVSRRALCTTPSIDIFIRSRVSGKSAGEKRDKEMLWKTYYLAPMRQRLFPGFFSTMPQRYIAKVKENAATVLPGFLFGYFVFTWGSARYLSDHHHHQYLASIGESAD